MKAILLATVLAGLVCQAAPARRAPATGGAKPLALSTNFQADAVVVREAQESALEMLNDLKEKADNPRSQLAIATVEKEMQRAIELLKEAKDSPAKLEPALAAQQAAYQALLRLAAHEYSVRQQSKKNQKGGEEGQRAAF